jgi:hypothetical protein
MRRQVEIVLLINWVGGIHSEIRCEQRSNTSANVIAAVRQLVSIANSNIIGQHLEQERIDHRLQQLLDA